MPPARSWKPKGFSHLAFSEAATPGPKTLLKPIIYIWSHVLIWTIGNILMISEGRSGSDNVFTLRDGSSH
jgi:hypothetical protein